MGLAFVGFLVGVLLAAGTLMWGATVGHRSLLVAFTGCVVCIVACGCAWYSWVESNSLIGMVGYLAVALGSTLAAMVNWQRNPAIN